MKDEFSKSFDDIKDKIPNISDSGFNENQTSEEE